MAWTTPKTWVAGAKHLASELNVHLRDNLIALWKGVAAGDMDYYDGATTKARLAADEPFDFLVMNGDADAPRWKMPFCNLYGNYYAASGALRVIEWYGAAKDTDAFWSAGSPTKITIPAGFDGIYLINSVVVHPYISSSIVRLYNSSNVQKAQFVLTRTTNYGHWSGIIPLFAGMWLENTISVATSANTTDQFFSLVRLMGTDVNEATIWGA